MQTQSINSKSSSVLYLLPGWALAALTALSTAVQPAPAQGTAGPGSGSGMMNTGFAGHPGVWQPGQSTMGGQLTSAPPAFQPGGSHANKYPKFNPDFWKGGGITGSSPAGTPGQTTNYISSGTVLSAILEKDLSSRTAKNGDVFALTLQDGFVVNGRMAIAPHSKILGTVISAIPAKYQKHGHPGSLEIALQTLVLPDGSHMPFFGFIDQNPNHLLSEPPKKRWGGFDLKDYAGSVAGMFSTMFTGPGWIHARVQRGNEFLLAEGEVLPVRLTRGLQVPEVPVAQTPPPAVAPGNALPGPLSGATTSGDAPASGGAPGLADSNEIFNAPLQPIPENQLPDPF